MRRLANSQELLDGPLDDPATLRDRSYTRVKLRALLAAGGLRPIVEVAAFAGHRVAIAAVRLPSGTVR